MRFSPLQEDNYGVGLGHDTPPQDVDKSMMAATGDVEPVGGSALGENSMISSLPLLFAKGYPTSLEKISLPELERFIAFMIQCSSSSNLTEGMSKPQWWPREIKFSIPLERPKKFNDTYMDILKKLVFRCYTYHNSEYLLRFCSYLAQYPHDKLEYVNNMNSTTSLFLKTTGKLLVTFRNENMNYDKESESPRKLLLSKPKSTHPNGTKILRRSSARRQNFTPSPAISEPITDDIYLCDNCDAEFIGQTSMKEHESTCYRVERPITPDAEVQPEIKQDQFMNYFALKLSKSDAESQQDNNNTNTVFNKSDSIEHRTSGRTKSTSSLTKYPGIPFSSPLGISLGKKSKTVNEGEERLQEQRLDRIERHSVAPPLSVGKPKWLTKSYLSNRWCVSYKPRRPTEYVRKHYNFGKYSKKLTLDIRSQLLYISCKPYIYPLLTRLSKEELLERKRDQSRNKSPERNAPRIRPRSPSVEPISEYGDEPHPIIIDLEDDEPYTSSGIHLNNHSYFQRFANTSSLPTATVNPLPNPESRFFHKTGISKKVKKKTNFASSISSAQSIIVVDLCSSDEEADEDENHDPLQKSAGASEMWNQPSYFNNACISPNKVWTRPCIYPNVAAGDWHSNYYNVSEPRKSNCFKQMSLYKNSGS